MTIEYIGAGGSDGTSFGQSGEKISFYGATPIAKATVAKTVTTTATNAQLSIELRAIRAHLNNLGLMG